MGNLNDFGHVLYRKHDRRLIIRCHIFFTIILIYHYNTSANFALFFRNTYIPNQSNTTDRI